MARSSSDSSDDPAAGNGLRVAGTGPGSGSRPRRSEFIALLLALTIILASSSVAAASPAPERATDAGCASGSVSTSCFAVNQGTPQTAAEQLAAKYAPIMELKQQTSPCDDKGEPYLPAPVEVVLGDPAVVLRKNMGGSDASKDPIVKRGPTAADLAGKGSDYYLDLPGDPREPGCNYERLSKERMVGRQPTIYAHIVADPKSNLLALQYWFYYVFNRFNNLHESDWEMIQLSFLASSPEEALKADAPSELAYAQHEGGEQASWDDAKVHKDGTHLIVYPASGSHASYYGSDTYLGWGENGSGVGCDITTGPSFRVVPQVVLVPNNPDPKGSFGWLLFQGRWGEKDSFPFDGPTSPNTKDKWTDPFTWLNGLRKSSLALGQTKTFGPDPAGLFCNGVAFVSGLYIQQKHYAWYTYSAAALLILVPLILLFLTRRLLAASIALYYRHAVTFLAIGAGLVVLGAIASYVDDALNAIGVVGDVVNSILDLATPTQSLFFQGSSGLPGFVGWTLVTPAVVYAVATIEAGRRPDVRESFRVALDRFWMLIRSVLRATIVLILLVISIVGIPWATVKLVRWSLIIEAVVLDKTGWRQAGKVSERSVIGRWWRTAATFTVVAFIIAAIAPVIGILVLIFVVPSVFWANVVSGVIYALTFPFAGIVATLWYLRRPGHVAPAVAEGTASTLEATAGDG